MKKLQRPSYKVAWQNLEIYCHTGAGPDQRAGPKLKKRNLHGKQYMVANNAMANID